MFYVTERIFFPSSITESEVRAMQDEKITELFFERSQEAIEETKIKYSSYCMKVATNILKSKQDAEECVNDSYMKLWSSIPPNRPASLKAYLAKIVRNLSLDKLEKQKAKKRGSGTAELVFDEICEFISTGGEQLADEIALREAINSFLASLDRQTRIIFVQRYWYFCSVKEIAVQLNVGESKVKMTLKRTRDKLREQLEKEGLDL